MESYENGADALKDTTKDQLKSLSQAMLRLHKTLLDQAKAEYEARNGTIASVNIYFQLVIDDPHFAWLRKISSLVALIDEARSVRRPATETEAQGLFNETRILFDFQDIDAEFNEKFQLSLQSNPAAVIGHNDVLSILRKS